MLFAVGNWSEVAILALENARKSLICKGCSGGQCITLTASTDVKTGTTGNDTFDGSTAGTLNTADVLSDGSTTDTDVLNAVSNAAPAAGTASATITNVETLNISGQYVAVGANLLNTNGSKTLNLSAGIEGATATVNDASATAVGKIVAGTNVQVLNIATNATTNTTGGTLTVDAGNSTTVSIDGKTGADAYDLTVSNKATSITLNGGTGVDSFTVKLAGNTAALNVDTGAIETLTLNSTGAANTLTLKTGAVALVGAAASGYKGVVTGDQNLTLVGNSAAGDLQKALSGLKIENTLSSGKTFTVKTGAIALTGAANLDTSKIIANVLDVATTNYFVAATNGNTMTINDGTTLKLSADATGTTGGIIQVQNAGGTIANTAGKLGTLTMDVAKTQTGAMTTGDQVGILNLSNTSATGAVTMASLVLNNNTDTVNISGTKDLTITSVDTGNGATVAATGLSGKLTIATIVGNDSVIVGGSGSDSITAGTATLTGLVVNGGDGNDMITAAALTAAGAVLAGGNGNDTITGGGAADTITGGAGNDLITGGVGLDVMTGGEGSDTFVFANNATGQPDATTFDTINDWGTGDKIDFTSAILLNATSAAAASGTAAISATGLATFHSADDTLLKKITAVEAGIAATGGAAAAGEAAVFVHGSDTYLFISDTTGGLSATDVLVKLVGVTAASGITLDGSGDITAIA